MILVFFLLGLLALLIVFLRGRGVPRRETFDVVHLSVWIFVIGTWLSLAGMDRFAPASLDGLLPFIPPVIPVIIFVAYVLRRLKVVQE